MKMTSPQNKKFAKQTPIKERRLHLTFEKQLVKTNETTAL